MAKVQQQQEDEDVISLKHDFDKLRNDLCYILKRRQRVSQTLDLGHYVNKAFQRLIHLLSDNNRMQVMAKN